MSEDSQLGADFLVAELVELGDVSAKGMFGGHGVFFDARMFALVTKEGEIFFKTSVQNQAKYDEAGSEQFMNMPYYALPEDVRENGSLLIEWARSSIDVALAAPSKKKR